MTWWRFIAACVAGSAFASMLDGAEAASATTTTTRKVASFTAEWHDSSRDRAVPVRIYHPDETGDAAYPVIVFSPGLGGSRDMYRYLGEYWAAHGYVCMHVQHPGSDDAVWKDQARPVRRLAKAAADTDNFVNRPQDVSFALDRLTACNQDASFALHGRLDLSRIGMAGHSFGAYTTMALAGQRFRRGSGTMEHLADPRIKAAIAMSTPVKNRSGIPGGHGYAEIAIPVYHLTGTLDSDPLGTPDPALRRVPYDQTRRAEAYLLTLDGGDHMVFSGQRRRGDGTHDAEFHRLIQESTTAFWDAWLKEDAAAMAWLKDDGFSDALGDLGTFEQKAPERGGK